MPRTHGRHHRRTPTHSHAFLPRVSHAALAFALSFLLILIPLAGCSKSPEQQLEALPAHIAAEIEAERNAAVQELLSRNTPTATDSDALWASYRKAYPFHSQAVALSEPSPADTSRTLVVSEPPPHINIGDILLPLGKLVYNHSVRQHNVGYDGWVKDVVVEIAGNDEREVDAALSALSRVLFGTSYMTYVLPLPARQPEAAGAKLDLQVTSAELKSWLLDTDAWLVPVEGGDAYAVRDVFGLTNSAVFAAWNGGLVGWWIPKGKPFDELRAQARQFALDSDLVVGALADARGVLILGRERVVPVDVLPPLRFETLSLLASVQKGDAGALAQSYERNHPLAGPVGNSWDWAPILLSDELRDTEYGSLLNITDQLLKGWSNGGDTRYHDFDKYPRPARWPFPDGITKRLRTSELVYNWNTRGAGYTVGDGRFELLALYRTGALPITYKPEGGLVDSAIVSRTEEEAYNYFAGLDDPNLARVVQYAALYQIFSAFDVARPSTPAPANPAPNEKLKELTNEVLSEIRGASDARVSELAEQLTPLLSAEIDRSTTDRQVDELLARVRRMEETRLRAEGLKEGTAEFESRVRVSVEAQRANLQRQVDEQRAKTDAQLRVEIEEGLRALRSALASSTEGQEFQSEILSLIAQLKNLPARYAALTAKGEGWIHTPSVVLSWNSGSMARMTGGHNLNARVTRFRVTEEVPSGTFDLDAQGRLLINPKDTGKLGGLVRRLDNASPTEDLPVLVKGLLSKGPTAPPRPLTSALALPGSGSTPPPNVPRRPPLSPASDGFGSNNLHWHTGWSKGGGQAKPDALAESLPDLRSEIPNAIRIDRDSEGLIHIAHNERDSSIVASTTEDVVDVTLALARLKTGGDADLRIVFSGFSEGEVGNFKESFRARATRENVPSEVSSIIGREEPTAADFYKGGRGGPNDPLPPGGGGPRPDQPFPAIWRNRGRYDFERAEVRTLPDINTLPDGTQVNSFVIEIPHAGSPGRTSTLTTELGYHRTTPREVIPLVTRRVADRVGAYMRSIRDDWKALRLSIEANREARRVARETGIDLKIIRQGFKEDRDDLYLRRHRKEYADEPPEAAGSQPA